MADDRCVALLRAVNVGGRNWLANADLVAAAAAAGCIDARAVKQSGNLVTRWGGDLDALAPALGSTLVKRMGLAAAVIVRTAAQWGEIVAADPWRAGSLDPSLRVAMVFDRDPSTDGLAALRRHAKAGETIVLTGRTAFIAYPNGIGRSALVATLVERCLAATGTARNLRTIAAIDEELAFL